MLLVLGVIMIIRERRLPIRETVIGLIIGLPWIVVAYKTYGGFIPQSVVAKDAIARIWPMTLRSSWIFCWFTRCASLLFLRCR